MKSYRHFSTFLLLSVFLIAAMANPASAQYKMTTPIPPGIESPDEVETRLGNAADATASTAAASPAANLGFSREFLRAWIEEMGTIRDWHGVLASAIGTKYALTQDGLAPYQARAMKNLRLAQAAAKTDADQKAAQLIMNEYEKMKELSDKYLAKRAILSYIELDTLKNDALDQSIIACGKSLAAMAASGQFKDDGACH